MRYLFTDGGNSLSHVLFGILAARYTFMIPLFLIYQYILKYDENSTIDVLEFAIGYVAARFIYLLWAMLETKGTSRINL